VRSQFQLGVEIRDANVYGSGGMPVRGRVAGNGAVSVSVASGEQRANGIGRLSASSGGGTWHGVGLRVLRSLQNAASVRRLPPKSTVFLREPMYGLTLRPISSQHECASNDAHRAQHG
jgi:hypothetical protein